VFYNGQVKILLIHLTELLLALNGSSFIFIGMIKLTLALLFTALFATAFSQTNFIVYKKKNETIATFWKGTFISFQLKNKEWIKGIITDIGKDSFSLKKQYIIYNLMHNDTFHVSGFSFALSDVYAMPKRGVQIDYNGRSWAINGHGGHVHWYWVKGGWIFRAVGAGYIGLELANSVINSHPVNASGFVIAGAAVLVGELLHYSYKLTNRVGKRYYLKVE